MRRMMVLAFLLTGTSLVLQAQTTTLTFSGVTARFGDTFFFHVCEKPALSPVGGPGTVTLHLHISCSTDNGSQYYDGDLSLLNVPSSLQVQPSTTTLAQPFEAKASFHFVYSLQQMAVAFHTIEDRTTGCQERTFTGPYGADLTGEHTCVLRTLGEFDKTHPIPNAYGARFTMATIAGDVIVDLIAHYSDGCSAPAPLATSACASDIAIDSLEFVQAVQQPTSSCTPRDGTDCVPLIAGKDTLLRVYPKLVNGTAPVSGVTTRISWNGVSYSIKVPRTVTQTTSPDRSDLKNSFNLRVPPAFIAAGVKSFQVDLLLNGAAPPLGSARTKTVSVEFVTPPLGLRVGWIPICVVFGLQQGFSCPTDKVGSYTDLSNQLFPVPVGSIYPKPYPAINLEFVRPDGFFEKVWKTLVQFKLLLDIQASPDPRLDFRFDHLAGWLPPIINFAGKACCESTLEESAKDRVSFQPDPAKPDWFDLRLQRLVGQDASNESTDPKFHLAQRLASGKGLTFAVATGLGDSDVGVDLSTGEVWTQYIADLTNRNAFGGWISGATFQQLLNKLGPLSTNSTAARAADTAPQEYAVITGTIQQDGSSAQIDPVLRIPSAIVPAPSTAGAYCVRISSPTATLGSTCFDPAFLPDITGAIPTHGVFVVGTVWPAGATQVSLVKGGTTLTTLTANGQPTVAITSPRQGDQWIPGTHTISWTSGGGAVASTVFYSPNGGTDWLPAGVNILDSHLDVNTTGMIGGPQVRFRVIVSNGINNAIAEVGPLTILQTPTIDAPASLDFGSADTDQVTDAHLIIRNTGSGPLTIRSLTPAANPPFSVISPTAPFDIMGGSVQDVVVRFTPTAAGTANGTLTVTSNDPSRPTVTVALVARASDTPVPNVLPLPATLSFSNVGVGKTQDLKLTLINTGTADLSVTNGAIGAPFQIVSGTTPFTVPAYGQQNITLRFAPTALGPAQGNFSLSTNDSAHPTLSVALSGTGVTACNYTLSGGTPNVGASGGGGTLTLTTGPTCGWSAFSNSLSWLQITSPQSGTGAASFNYTVLANTGATRSGILYIADQQFTVTQAGSGAAPALSISKTHSGVFTQGQTGVLYTVTVSNAAGAGPTSGAVTVTENAPTGLALVSMSGTGWTCVSQTCTRSDALAAGQVYPAITVTVNVASGATSPLVNSVTVTGGGSGSANATDSTVIQPTTSSAALSISKRHSGTFAPGQSGATYTVTVSNAASAGPTVGTVTATENPPTGMTLVSMAGTGWSCASATCTRSDALAAGQSYPAITVTVNVASNTASTLINSVTVTGGGSGSANATDPTVIQPATGILRTLVFHEITSQAGGANTTQNYAPVLSKNGSRAVFASGNGNPMQVFVVNADGNSAPVQVDSYNVQCTCGVSVFISDDGSSVASSEGRQIRWAPADGSGARTLVTADNSISAIRISPDGASVFFLLFTDANINGAPASKGLYAINSNGTGMRQIVSAANLNSALGTNSDVRFSDGGMSLIDSSSDASRLIFNANVLGTGFYLMAVNSNGQNLHKLAGPLIQTYNAAISGDGNTVFYNILPPPSNSPDQVGVMNFDGSGRRVLATGMDGNGRSGQITADGSQVIVENGGRVYRTDGDGFYTLAITTYPISQTPLIGATNVSMNSTGTRFLYTSPDAAGKNQLVTIDLNPSSAGSAPTISNPAIAPAYVLLNDASTATATARVTSPGTLLGESTTILFGGIPDPNTRAGYLYDDASHGDATAADGTFTNNGVFADCCATVGSRSVRFQAEARVGAAGTRRHAVAVDYAPFSVLSQPPPVCTYSISPANANLGNGAGTFTPVTGSFTLTAANCTAADTWTAVSDSPRLTITSAASGSGATASATISFSMFTNSTSQPRTAHITVGGKTFTVTQAGTSETQAERVVRALYQTILGREPDAGGFAFWSGSGAPRNASGAVLFNQMADGFYTSAEFKNSGWLALNIYQAVTGQLPNFATWLSAVSKIRAQTLSPTQLTNNVAGSVSNASFVAAAYQNAFGRGPSPSESTAAITALNGGQSKFDFLNTTIFASSEFTSRTNGALIQALFYTILVRDPDAGGFNFWLGQINPPNGQNGIYYLYNPQPVTPAYTFKLAVIGQAVPPNPNLLGFLGSPEFQGLIQ